MQASVTVTLEQGEAFSLTADEAALAVLQALGGDPAAGDYAECFMRVVQSGAAGEHPGAVQAAAENAARVEELRAAGLMNEDGELVPQALDDAVANDDAPEPDA